MIWSLYRQAQEVQTPTSHNRSCAPKSTTKHHPVAARAGTPPSPHNRASTASSSQRDQCTSSHCHPQLLCLPGSFHLLPQHHHCQMSSGPVNADIVDCCCFHLAPTRCSSEHAVADGAKQCVNHEATATLRELRTASRLGREQSPLRAIVRGRQGIR